jgi:hypothetical protein
MDLTNLTEQALATIASILDYAHRSRPEEPATASPSIAPMEADGYTKLGPGPIESVRFRWTVRRAENDEYFVDESIGENSPSVVVGPMTAEAAIELVDERESTARQRFEEIRNEMISRGAAAGLVQSSSET